MNLKSPFVMSRIKQPPSRVLTPKEKSRLEALYRVEDMLLEWLLEHRSEHPDYPVRVRQLHENEIRILRLEGGPALEVNEDFGR